MLEVREVTSLQRLRDFLRLPHLVYSESSPWVPPLTWQTLIQLGGPRDPHRRLLVAYDGERPVARIGVRIFPGILHFGFFECLEGYPEAARLLVEQGHALAPHLPLRGPCNFRLEDPYTGLLVDGFEQQPTFWSSYNPPYYVSYLADCGLSKVQDLNTYRCDWDTLRLEPVERRALRAKEREVSVRTLDRKDRVSDIRQVAAVMNEALQGNWGFEPFDEDQIKELTLLSYLFLDPRWLFLAESSSRVVGCCIVLPDYNPWIRKTRGRLTPWLLWKLLFAKEELGNVRAWGLGVLESHRKLFAAPALIGACVDRCRELGVAWAEISWILEDNGPMNAMLGTIGAQKSRVHRVLERDPIQRPLESPP